jgi:hypothetical protein
MFYKYLSQRQQEFLDGYHVSDDLQLHRTDASTLIRTLTRIGGLPACVNQQHLTSASVIINGLKPSGKYTYHLL